MINTNIKYFKDNIPEFCKDKLWLAPLSGYTNSVFRRICKSLGADVVVSEMISAYALKYKNVKTKLLLSYLEYERPLGLQIFGDNEDIIATGIKILKKFQPDFVDINMGCPVKKVTKNGSGAAILKDIDKIKRIIAKSVSILQGDIPLTVKIRSGWDSSKDLLKITKTIAEEGAAAIILHPRTKNQMFQNKSNWNLIAKVKESIHIPIIGNGDINSPEDAKAMYLRTGCDSIMIGRASIGNPWIFQQIKDYMNNGEYYQINIQDKLNMIIRHFEDLEILFGAGKAIKLMRKFIPGYIKGFKNASFLRTRFNYIKYEEEFYKVVKNIQKILCNE